MRFASYPGRFTRRLQAKGKNTSDKHNASADGSVGGMGFFEAHAEGVSPVVAKTD